MPRLKLDIELPNIFERFTSAETHNAMSNNSSAITYTGLTCLWSVLGIQLISGDIPANYRKITILTYVTGTALILTGYWFKSK